MSEYTEDVDKSHEAYWEFDGLIDEIWQERKRQILIGYTHEHDDEYGVMHLVGWASAYVGRDPNRENILKAIALLVAAVEVMDRDAP